MALQRISFPDRASWLNGRSMQGIGASEAAAVCGMSPWLSKNELWEEKVGIRQRRDISENAQVQRGTNTEGAIRGFYAALHPEYRIEHHPYDILFQEERPWLFATLDGEIEAPEARTGILEIKTSAPNSKGAWAEWYGQIPQAYFCQCLHQLLATGWDFVILQAALWGRNGDITLKDPYIIGRTEYEADLAWLLRQEEEFWESVKTGKRPGAPIRF